MRTNERRTAQHLSVVARNALFGRYKGRGRQVSSRVGRSAVTGAISYRKGTLFAVYNRAGTGRVELAQQIDFVISIAITESVPACQ